MMTIKYLTAAEREQASHALVQWFMSQGISPADGSLIMLSTIADQLTNKTLDVDDLQKTCDYSKEWLMLEVADFVKRKREML